MANTPPSATRLSLLSQLRHQQPENGSAWQVFVDYYGPKIGAWCGHWGLQESDAQDVTQAVLVKLATKMRTFAYQSGGSFRAWLKTLARHAWSDFIADRQRAGRNDQRDLSVLETLPARDDLEARLAEAFDMEMLELATAQVRRRVQAQTWDAFRLTALEGLSGADAASQLAMPVASVFKAKSNVQKLLQEAIRELEGSHPS